MSNREISAKFSPLLQNCKQISLECSDLNIISHADSLVIAMEPADVTLHGECRSEPRNKHIYCFCRKHTQ